jgi:molybdenum cofactor synthesis domain-containing protein
MSDGMLRASVVVIGDEILGGYVTDTNSPWLADRLRLHGVPLDRVQVVPDERADIAEALHAELSRVRPRVIVTSGGIGSTPDDITYEAVAAAVGREVVEDADIVADLARSVEWTRAQGMAVDDATVWHLNRMARIPEGCRLLRRATGWTPAVLVDIDGGAEAGGATIVVLPGVPSEFRSLVEEVVEPALLAGRNERPAVVELTHSFPESMLNLAFVDLMTRHPSVKLGSYPGQPMIVRLSGPAAEVEAAAALVSAALDALESGPGGARVSRAWRHRGVEDLSETDDASDRP